MQFISMFIVWECYCAYIYSSGLTEIAVTAVAGVFVLSCLQANRWRKRGLAVVPLKFSIGWDGAPYTVFVSIYSEDGTVAIAHAGIEIGQGINTKVSTYAVCSGATN